MSGSNSSAHGDPSLAEPLTLTVHSVGVPAADDDDRRTRQGRLRMLAVLLACAAPVVASYFTYFVLRPQGQASQGTLIQPARPIPALPLRTPEGAVVAAESLKGQWLLVAVGPSACDAACERRLYTQRQLREMVGKDRDRVDKVWFVTDDGAVSPRLRQALEQSPGMHVLRVDHALQDHLYIVDPRGDWMLRVSADPDPSKFKRDLERLLRVSAPWDPAGR
jgi:hypothetical protein